MFRECHEISLNETKPAGISVLAGFGVFENTDPWYNRSTAGV